MTLDEYLATPSAPSLTDLSAKLGISKGRLSQIKKSGDWPPELAMKAEKETDGALCASILSPLIAEARKDAA